MLNFISVFSVMDLRSHYPYWLLRHGFINSYPSLDRDLQTEVVVMGAGISGAIIAWQLCRAGYKVIIVDRRHAGMGSTAASTALLQYELDVPLYKLAGMIGEKKAMRSYLLCREAIYKLEDICRDFSDQEVFCRKPSFQFASFKAHVPGLQREYTLRKKAGLRVTLLDESAVRHHYGFSKPAGLLSEDGAEADAYKITHFLLSRCIAMGSRVYDHTEITGITRHKKDITLITAFKKKIRARHLVIACGYESQQYIPRKVQHLKSTFAIASEPFITQRFWHRNSLIWETADPYLYLRTTSDNRIIIGGKDSMTSNPEKRDRLLPQKVKALERSFKQLFPSLPFKTDFRWAGNFASTTDGLPYIGAIPGLAHTWFSLGYGGNGTTFSVIAAEMIRDFLKGKKNKDAEIFSFNR